MENNDDPIVPIPVSHAAQSAIMRQAAEGRSVWSEPRWGHFLKWLVYQQNSTESSRARFRRAKQRAKEQHCHADNNQ